MSKQLRFGNDNNSLVVKRLGGFVKFEFARSYSRAAGVKSEDHASAYIGVKTVTAILEAIRELYQLSSGTRPIPSGIITFTVGRNDNRWVIKYGRISVEQSTEQLASLIRFLQDAYDLQIIELPEQ